MRIAIMGFPRSGKTTLFNVLARAHAPTGGAQSSSRGLNVGTVNVPDPRLETLRDLFNPKKYTPARVQYVDQAGTAPAGREEPDLLGSQEMRAAELIVCAIRAFRDPAVSHPFDTVDPARDIRRFSEEMLLKDLQVVENRLSRLEKNARLGAGGDEEAEIAILARCREALEAETPLRALEFSAAEAKRIRGFQLLTAKPLVTALNIDEADLPEGPPVLEALAASALAPRTALVAVAARTEMELAALEGAERLEFMSLLGITESSLDKLIRVSYDLLGLSSFFTVGPDEVRAWTIESGGSAVDAAAAIHSDLARGFIRAEVAGWGDLVEAGGYGGLKVRGRLRLEGRHYRVQDGDVLNIRFSV